MRLAAVAALGFAWCAWRAHVALDARLPEEFEGRDLDVIGVVADLPLTRPDGVRATLRVERASLDGADVALHGDIRIAWYAADPELLAPCSRWQLHVRLKRPRGLVNPGGFDGERSALERGIVATGYVRDEGTNRRIGERAMCVDGLRERISREIAERIPEQHDAALMRAFAVGDTRGLDEDDWETARANGIPHLIAISGFHVGVAAGLGALLVRLSGWLFPRLALRVPRRYRGGTGGARDRDLLRCACRRQPADRAHVVDDCCGCTGARSAVAPAGVRRHCRLRWLRFSLSIRSRCCRPVSGFRSAALRS